MTEQKKTRKKGKTDRKGKEQPESPEEFLYLLFDFSIQIAI